MRTLTDAETRFVAGGEVTDLGEVVVTGKRNQMSRDEIDRIMSELDSGGGSGYSGGGGGGGQSFGLDRIGSLLDKILEKLLFGPGERETKIAEEFGDHRTVERVVSESGDFGWRMDNGDIYWDTNNNGRPDLVTRVDSQGNRFYNAGEGWTSFPGNGWGN